MRPRGTGRSCAYSRGWDFAPSDLYRHDFAENGYANGVPMGGDLTKAPDGKRPVLMVYALRDPDGPNLDRIQIVKGWLNKDGTTGERIFDVAVSGKRKIGPDGRCKTLVGSTVDVANASYSNSIGAPLLSAYWKDPAFDATQHAFYYVRVIQIPSPRWTAYDQKRFGIKMAELRSDDGHRSRLHLTHLVHTLKRLIREPLFHFLVLSALIFCAYAWLNPGASAQQVAGTVRITGRDVAWLADTWVRQQQRPPTREELRGLVTEYLKEQLLAREARSMGLDQDDLIVRRRLAQKLEFLVEDTPQQAEPTEQDLLRIYKASPDQFQSPARVSFTQIYFSRERRHDAAADAKAALAELSHSTTAPALLTPGIP